MGFRLFALLACIQPPHIPPLSVVLSAASLRIKEWIRDFVSPENMRILCLCWYDVIHPRITHAAARASAYAG